MSGGLFSIVFSGLATYANYEAGREELRYNRQQEQIKTRINLLKDRRAKVEAYRERRRAEAEVVQTSLSSNGGNNSSGLQGGLASIGSQFVSNQNYASQLNKLSVLTGGDRSRIDNLRSRAQLYGALSSFTEKVFGEAAELAGKGG